VQLVSGLLSIRTENLQEMALRKKIIKTKAIFIYATSEFRATNNPSYLRANYLVLAARLRNWKCVARESISSISEQNNGHAAIKLLDFVCSQCPPASTHACLMHSII